MGLRQETGVGVVSVPDSVTRLPRLGRTCAIQSRLALSRPRFAACGLDRMTPARLGLAKQLRLSGKRNASKTENSGRGIALLANAGTLETFCRLATDRQNRRQQVFLRCGTTVRPCDFRSVLTRCLSSDGPDERASESWWKRKAKGLARPMTTECAPECRLTPAFCGLPKPSAGSSLARRVSRRPRPTITNRGHDRDRFVSEKAGSNGARPGGRGCTHLDSGANC